MTDQPKTAIRLPGSVAILILDDERFDRHRLARLCSGLEMQTAVTYATCLLQLDDCLSRTAFNLIFIDHNLPDGTGIDALSAIRLSPRNCNSAVIMVTGQGQDDTALAAIKGGCSDYITKDELNAASFSRSVTNALQKSVLSRQIATQTFRRSEVEAVLASFATECARDIKPTVSRMMRQLRDVRDAPGDGRDNLAGRCETLEESCMHLWEFLINLERHQSGNLIDETMAKTAADNATDPPKSRRPPSPFARLSS